MGSVDGDLGHPVWRDLQADRGVGDVVADNVLDQGVGDGIGHWRNPFGYILKTPKRVSGIGAFSEADMAKPKTSRVCAGSITPSSQSRAVA